MNRILHAGKTSPRCARSPARASSSSTSTRPSGHTKRTTHKRAPSPAKTISTIAVATVPASAAQPLPHRASAAPTPPAGTPTPSTTTSAPPPPPRRGPPHPHLPTGSLLLPHRPARSPLLQSDCSTKFLPPPRPPAAPASRTKSSGPTTTARAPPSAGLPGTTTSSARAPKTPKPTTPSTLTRRTAFRTWPRRSSDPKSAAAREDPHRRLPGAAYFIAFLPRAGAKDRAITLRRRNR